MADDTPEQFATALLHRLHIQPTSANVRALVGWQRAEGGHWNNDAKYNPLNTTQSEPGAGNTGTQGNIKVYKNWHQGIEATATTLLNGKYGGILSALKNGSSGQVAHAIGNSPWGTSADLINRVIGSTPATKVSANSPLDASVGSTTPVERSRTEDIPGASSRVALARYLASVNPNNLLLRTGAISTDEPTTRKVAVNPAAIPPTSSSLGAGASNSGHYVDPFGSSLKAPGRIDEGVDPTIHGSIKAIGNAKVVALQHNFYKGQPYLVYQLTDGPHRGKYVYVSELIDPHVKPGQTVRAGQTIATGHGAIETGWAGGAKGSFLPLANRAQGGNYTEGLATGHGKSFAQFLRSLGVKADG